MARLSVATTINPRFDHVTPIEATRSDVTITHRCHVFAELMAIGRSGLVDVVLVADDFELVSLETLEQLLDTEGQGPRLAAISDVLEDRQRLTEIGIPVAPAQLTGQELIAWLREVAQHDKATTEVSSALSPEELHTLEYLDPDAPPKRRSGRRAAPYNPTTDIPEPLDGSIDTETTSLLPVPVDRQHQTWWDRGAPSDSNRAVDQQLSEDATTADTEDNEVVDLIHADDDAPLGHITAVWGPIGSPGATTLAVNIAVETALAGARTLLIDADTYGAAVAVHLGLLGDTAAIAQACRAAEHRGLDTESLSEYTQRVTVQGAGIDVLTGLTRSERWPQLRAAAWGQVLDVARGGWDHIIIDCGFGLEEDEELSFDIPAPQRNATTITAVTKAHTVVAIGTGDPVGFVRYMRAIEQLAETTQSNIIPVINKVTSMTSGLSPQRQLTGVWQRFGPRIALQHFISWAPEVTAAALLSGKTLAESAPKAAIRQTIREITHAILPAGTPRSTGHDNGMSFAQKSKRSLRTLARNVKRHMPTRK